MMKPRRLAAPDGDEDILAEFCAMLIDALQIAEVRAAVTDAVSAEQYRRDMWPPKASTPPPATGPARAQPHRRGGR
jgi:hypothetical protein